MKKLLLLIAFLTSGCSSGAVPSLTDGFAVTQTGVQIHQIDSLEPGTVTYNALTTLKPYWVRAPIIYNEPMDWTWYDNLMALGLHVIFITPDSTQGYDRTDASVLSSVSTLSNFISLAAKRYPQAAWEIGNEPNAVIGDNSPITVTTYATYARAMITALRSQGARADDGAGLSGIRLDYLSAMKATGVLDLCDVIGMHPYNQPQDYADYFSLMKQIKAVVGDKPVWWTEYGQPHDDDQDQYSAVSRYFKQGSSPVAIWYSLYGDGQFDLINEDGTPRPAARLLNEG